MTTAADSVNGTCAAVSSGSNARYEAPASARYEYLDHRLDTTGKKKHVLREKGSFWLDKLIVKHLRNGFYRNGKNSNTRWRQFSNKYSICF